jgi:hypothetical protein
MDVGLRSGYDPKATKQDTVASTLVAHGSFN